ncbi:hypothetical protein VP511E551_P0061 [Vibrio phage 511E55-1]|nr:hypothetical protein VP511E551_P0061 [Vibrio phage 511E55-1]
MKFSVYVENLNKLLKDRPDTADMEVVTSKDDKAMGLTLFIIRLQLVISMKSEILQKRRKQTLYVLTKNKTPHYRGVYLFRLLHS